MEKKLDLSHSVYELTQTYPELVDLLASLGFTEITKKAMLHSVGKIMSIPKGAVVKGIPMEKVILALMDAGYTLVGERPNLPFLKKQATPKPEAAADEPASRAEKLKSYLKRLGAGEDLEAVRAEFAANFADVDAAEIMQAEQQLMAEGTPLGEVQRLCDLHSALFHGATKEERIMNAEKAVAASMTQKQSAAQAAPAPQADYANRAVRAADLASTAGHPLFTLTRENEALTALLADMNAKLDANEPVDALLSRLREVSIHYAKKGDLLYPHLKVKYGITGPSDVMWTVDDEIRDELGRLDKIRNRDEEWLARLRAVMKRAEEMIYKEANILFPISAVNFTRDEWFQIYRDAKDYAPCLGVAPTLWPDAEAAAVPAPAQPEGEIVMPGGHMSLAQLTAMLNTLPLELSFIDDRNINRYFNEGPKVFKRAGMAIDRDVFSCHPPKIEPMVRSILDGFRSGARDQVQVWMEKAGRTMLVTYMAVRDRGGNYLGTLETVQDMEEIKKHFGV